VQGSRQCRLGSSHFADFYKPHFAGKCERIHRLFHRLCGFVHRESLAAAPSSGRRTDYGVDLDPAGSQKKKPHPTIARGAGRLHRPRFPDAHPRTTEEGRWCLTAEFTGAKRASLLAERTSPIWVRNNL